MASLCLWRPAAKCLLAFARQSPTIRVEVANVNRQSKTIQNTMASVSTSTNPTPGANSNGQTYRGPFTIMTTLFFMWGFMTVFNDILIPRFKEAFTLDYVHATLVQLAFFGAYFIGSLVYFVISATTGDPIAKIGYKNGVVIGLLISATGSGLFWPAANATSYPMFLLALFVVGLGFAMLQIAANPYVTILGPEKTASSRLNLAQGFNSIGTTIGPLIGGYLIFQYFARTGAHGAESVKVPYLAFCVIFLVLAAIFFFIHLPHVGEGRIERSAGALKYPHVILGVLAIFMYVGGEVSIGSYIISFLKQSSIAGLPELEASKYVALYWGGLMIGRFMGAVELSEMRAARKQLLLVIIPLLAWLLLWVAKSAPLDALQGGSDVSVLALWRDAFAANWPVFRIYLPFVGLCWLLFQFGQSRAGLTLMIFSLTVVTLLLTAILVGGKVAMWCVVAVGLFTSIGWSNTFSLALEGTGIYKSQVSSLLVMAILGGAILPPLQGKIADTLIAAGNTHGLQVSFIVPLVAYAYVAFYGAKGHSIGRRAPAN
jgi:MFS transporter, FHS family, L-fucose permease